MDKREVSQILDEIGLLLELKGDSPFKSNAYYNAARTVAGLSEDLSELVASGRIREFKGIGQALSEKLAELIGSGRLAYYEDLKRSVPPGLLEMTAIPGLGPKKITAVWEKLGVTTLGELEYACIENRLTGLPGFGQKTQEKIRQGILQVKRRRGYHLYANAVGDAHDLLTAIRRSPGIGQAELVGDFRRRMEVVRSMEFLVGGASGQGVVEALSQVECLKEVSRAGRVITARSMTGLPVTVTVLREIAPHALLAATGSEMHLGTLAARAARMNVPWSVSLDDGACFPEADSEEALYARLDLPFIEPELREGLDELELADAGKLGSLVDLGQVRGIFHTHTTYSDGSAGLEEMVEAARALGYSYIGISDHSQSAFYANGLKEDRIREQHAAIDALRRRVTGISVLKGIEADILADGSMDYPDEVLARFDFVIASVHSRFQLSEEEQTARVIRALANPHVTMLGHPTGRLLLSREGYRIDMKRVIDAAGEYGKVIEINANPHRLDLDWRLCRYAKARGVRVSINPDAHATDGLQDVQFGVNVARKGGLEASLVVNTLGPAEVLAALR